MGKGNLAPRGESKQIRQDEIGEDLFQLSRPVALVLLAKEVPATKGKTSAKAADEYTKYYNTVGP